MACDGKRAVGGIKLNWCTNVGLQFVTPSAVLSPTKPLSSATPNPATLSSNSDDGASDTPDLISEHGLTDSDVITKKGDVIAPKSKNRRQVCCVGQLLN